jgi:ubiquinone/menaquinone biosynthesis C-methylase UbiE
MGLYSKHLLPRIVHFTCGMKLLMRQRAKLVPLAEGRVLEIGAGSGLNLPFYDAHKVSRLWALEPSIEIWKLAEIETRRLAFPVEYVPARAESIPLDNDSADTVVITYSLCTIPDVRAALAETRRVLRGGGKLLFCEHGLAPDADVRKWQNRFNPLWKVLGGGCHLNRDIPTMLRAAGYKIDTMDTLYLPGWKPVAFNYWGVAT